jgi:exodeoxyribonuclease III
VLARTVRLLTYNLLAGEDADAFERLAQATVLLQQARPDVLVLNECNLLAGDGGRELLKLEGALGMEAALAIADSGYHVAVLQRGGRFVQVERLQRGFAHAALVALIGWDAFQLTVIGAHLDPYSPSARVLEAQRLVEHVRRAETSVLLGDLNALSPHDVASLQPARWVERYRQRHIGEDGVIDVRAIAALEAAGLVDVHAALHPRTRYTRPSDRYAQGDRPRQRLDYIFASPSFAATATACGPYDHPFAQQASDHLPVYADLAAGEIAR